MKRLALLARHRRLRIRGIRAGLEPVARAARNGTVPAASTPKWPAAWKRAWRVDVGEGYSSPVVAAGRVFVHSRRDPDELVTAIDLATGKVVVAAEVHDAVQQEPVRDQHGERAALHAAGDRRPRCSRSAGWRSCRRGTRRPARWPGGRTTRRRSTRRSSSPARRRRRWRDGGSVDRAGRQRRQGRTRHRARPADRRRALDVDGQRSRLRLARRHHRRRRQADRHDDQRLDRRDRREDRRLAVVGSLPRRVAREHRHADLDRDAPDRVGQPRRARTPTRCG